MLIKISDYVKLNHQKKYLNTEVKISASYNPLLIYFEHISIDLKSQLFSVCRVSLYLKTISFFRCLKLWSNGPQYEINSELVFGQPIRADCFKILI